jgi:hypothetical protein
VFPGDVDLEEAAALFDGASDEYRAAQEAVEAGIADWEGAHQIAVWLRKAAKAERAVGEIFLARSQ